MKTINVAAPMHEQSAKCEKNRSKKIIFHALIISFLAFVGGCQTIGDAVSSVPAEWYERAAAAVVTWLAIGG